ncbi:hypothetical protein D3C73_897100 [compost metagenome]
MLVKKGAGYTCVSPFTHEVRMVPGCGAQSLADHPVSITPFNAVIEPTGPESLVALNHNRPAAYLLPPAAYQQPCGARFHHWEGLPPGLRWHSLLAQSALCVLAVGIDP